MKLGKATGDTEGEILKKAQKTADDAAAKAADPGAKVADSKLTPQLQTFVKLIFNKTLMAQ